MNEKKYTANGNSFILFDITDTSLTSNEKKELVIKKCQDRDGALFVETKDGMYFMEYYNKDGSKAPFCGNGARAFLFYLIKEKKANVDKFLTESGIVSGKILNEKILIKMPNPLVARKINVENFSGYLLTVGVPHFVTFVDDIEHIDVKNIGKKIRNKLDANVNFVEKISKNEIKVRTFERGVEDETLSCGSGVTASAIVLNESKVKVHTRGGILHIYTLNDGFYLEGDVENV
ncbi:diaminopimelate epimerase [Thermosipho melanesiensis]|uniref:Diaminopimelate epimerase n=2 Tax=Thermosipho melanesiensis TaxID=46541 RepID=A6LP57_THEM4|nr:diaminopimelate epimerase [Thermosipho melanesiensis]ABR31708.1 Diaminopimelate epimerase [Thermosipho melanesiensis BI429]APT74731.1 diaminopimelate epimerase [Thermosipho melanesiensis]OOC35232.1 diaminopimelate epimerase [Thermosipho melanesiensis]OOC35442.1 diaminopimelate epimerase [Thermosipho melanesiensis]OOC36693.1 diaminopimelate epimerase [Thermosipho melanesiensis]